MGYLQIETTNKDFSFILEKNPSTGLQFRKNKKGVLAFWFSKDDTIFNAYFKDSSTETSYLEHSNEDFNYGSYSKYNNARMYCDMFQELFAKGRVIDNAKDKEGELYSINLNLIETQYKTIDIFQRYYSKLGITIDCENIVDNTNNYRVVISTNTRSLRYLLNVANFFVMFASLNSDDFIFIAEEMVEKYLEIANYLESPYFMKYLIKIRMIRSRNKFENLKDKLEFSTIQKIIMDYGNTHDSRIEFIKQHIYGHNSVIDIGSGEDYRYVRFLAPEGLKDDKLYYAIDIDKNAQFKLKRYAENKNLHNISIFDTLEAAIEQYTFNGTKELVDVLCTEVLEHNTIEEAEKIIIKVLKSVNVNKFVITVPNIEFNTNYEHDGFRHPDHKWEIPYVAFQLFIQSALEISDLDQKFEVTFYQVGDQVDGIAVSSGCIIKAKI